MIMMSLVQINSFTICLEIFMNQIKMFIVLFFAANLLSLFGIFGWSFSSEHYD